MTSETPKCETKPPEGYATWLDYVIDRAGEGGVWSWEPDHARAELAALRAENEQKATRIAKLEGMLAMASWRLGCGCGASGLCTLCSEAETMIDAALGNAQEAGDAND